MDHEAIARVMGERDATAALPNAARARISRCIVSAPTKFAVFGEHLGKRQAKIATKPVNTNSVRATGSAFGEADSSLAF
jgi:hypothetical protein